LVARAFVFPVVPSGARRPSRWPSGGRPVTPVRLGGLPSV